jgi:hypothetical protein
VRLIWRAEAVGDQKIIYTVRYARTQKISIPDCFGRLGDKIAADVIRWLTRDNIVTAAKVAKIVGGTPRHPKLGCVLELTTYPGTET